MITPVLKACSKHGSKVPGKDDFFLMPPQLATDIILRTAGICGIELLTEQQKDALIEEALASWTDRSHGVSEHAGRTAPPQIARTGRSTASVNKKIPSVVVWRYAQVSPLSFTDIRNSEMHAAPSVVV